jgi:hypothetical protein
MIRKSTQKPSLMQDKIKAKLAELAAELGPQAGLCPKDADR